MAMDMRETDSGIDSAAADIRLGKSSDPRALRTRKALRDGFLALIENTPYDDVTPSQIAKKAGVARGSFYLHYPTKDALLSDLARDAMADLYDLGMQALDSGGSRAAAMVNCQHIEKNKVLWTTLLNGGAGSLIREEYVRLARQVAKGRSMPGDRLPATLSTAVSSRAIVEIIAWWLRQETPYSAEFVADLMVELIFNPIRAVSTSPDLKFVHEAVEREKK
jgi:AcrR family transcriptional regulator